MLVLMILITAIRRPLVQMNLIIIINSLKLV